MTPTESQYGSALPNLDHGLPATGLDVGLLLAVAVLAVAIGLALRAFASRA